MSQTDVRGEIASLQAETLGEPEIVVAILDGPVDLTHECFAGSNIELLPTLVTPQADNNLAAQHGTHVTSILFGEQGSGVAGIAPRCKGLVVPIFQASLDGGIRACSQLDLARGIFTALDRGVRIINVSGGQLDNSGEPEAYLALAMKRCEEEDVLVVVAAGNDGCSCVHVPGASPNALVVGAMDHNGEPLEFSNWGEAYRNHGVLAPGEDIPGAIPGGKTTTATGTSFAAPIVSGVAALLMSMQRRRGDRVSGRSVREAILKSAVNCDVQPATDCVRLLSGRLNVTGAMKLLFQGNIATMSEKEHSPGESQIVSTAEKVVAADAKSEKPCGCGGNKGSAAGKSSGCGGGGSGPQFVYALGQIDYDFGTEANRDAFKQLGVEVPEDRAALVRYLTHFEEELLMPLPPKPFVSEPPTSWELEQLFTWERSIKNRLRSQQLAFSNQAHVQQITWVLKQDDTILYAIQPLGAFAQNIYLRLIEFLEDQVLGEAEMIALPGQVIGKTKLMNGQEVPVLLPDLRGLFNWSIAKLVEASKMPEDHGNLHEELRNFVQRVYFDLKNLGTTSRERAINYAATNIFQVKSAFAEVIRKSIADAQWKLDSIEAERSSTCRPGSDCWDVKLTFFQPAKRLEAGRQIHRFTVDVSQVIPVTVGPVRSWLVY